MSRAAIQLLRRRWGLPDAATPVLSRFFSAWAAGHTSLELSDAEAELLASSPAVTHGRDGARPTPLVVRGTRLQSWRLDQAETRVATRLRALAHEDVAVSRTPAEPAAPEAADDLAQLFPDPQSAQRRAAGLGLRRALTLVTGGPGTGKTTTAARLGEAIGQTAQTLDGLLAPVRLPLERAAGQARTLHRLLGWNSRTDRCRFHAGNPLPADVVVVDEASMLDLALWDRLLSAMGRGTRLVVLGDHRQLESVQPGRVLADMIIAADGGALHRCHVELDHNYRFESHPGISRLAAAIRQYDDEAAVETLTSTVYREELAHYASEQIDDALGRVWPQIMEVVRAPEPAPALAALARVRILCALRRGHYGVAGINARVEARLRREGRPAGEWTHGAAGQKR